MARLKQFIDRELRRAEKKLGTPRVGLVIATSGTAAALAEASGHVRKGTGREEDAGEETTGAGGGDDGGHARCSQAG